MDAVTYQARCHCGRVRFRFTSPPISTGCRCNCSFCVRRGAVMSPVYLPPAAVGEIEGFDALTLYQFGERSTKHYFCSVCGICPFHIVDTISDDYVGTAKPGYLRINLSCVDELDVDALEITTIDGRAY